MDEPGCSVFSYWSKQDKDNRCRWEKTDHVGECRNTRLNENADLYAIPRG